MLEKVKCSHILICELLRGSICDMERVLKHTLAFSWLHRTALPSLEYILYFKKRENKFNLLLSEVQFSVIDSVGMEVGLLSLSEGQTLENTLGH